MASTPTPQPLIQQQKQNQPEEEEATPLTDPQAYLALFKFSRRLRRCPRTGLSVSYSDIGDPDGVPVLFVPPSGCSRWFAAPQDPLAAGYGLRIIVVDRPGVGAVPMVPLSDRIDVSCKLIVSVLEHLNVKVAHMFASSAGVFCALHLLSTYPQAFLTGLAPPPAVYLVSPWSPPLPATDPLAYRQLLDWIPNTVIETQDLTLPYVIPALKNAEEVYGSATKAVGSAVDAVKGWWSALLGGVGAQPAKPTAPLAAAKESKDDKEQERHHEENEKELPDSQHRVGVEPVPMPSGDAANTAADNSTAADSATESQTGSAAEGEEPPRRRRLWAPSAKDLTTDYIYAEEFRGIGQEHLLCLNRGSNTGPEWFVDEIAAIAAAVRKAQGAAPVEKVDKKVETATKIDATPSSTKAEAGGGGGEAPDQAQHQRQVEREGGDGAGNGDHAVDDGNRSTHPTSSPSPPAPNLDKLGIDVWWGGQDGMVPRNGQEWLNKALAAHPREIRFAAHFIEDGDHTDLMLRAQGIGEVYTAMMVQGHSTVPFGSGVVSSEGDEKDEGNGSG